MEKQIEHTDRFGVLDGLPRRSVRRRALVVAVVLAHLAFVPGALLVLEFGRPRFAGLFLYAVVAVVVFDLCYLLSRADRATTHLSAATSLAGTWQVPTATLFVSVILLTTVGRGLAFYAATSVFFTLVLLRVATADEGAVSVGSTLVLVVLGSLTLLGGQVLTVAFYLGVSDTIVHTYVTRLVVEAEGLSAIADSRYYWFSRLHVVSAMGVTVTDLPPRLFIAALVAFVFQIAVGAVYLVLVALTGSVRGSLLGATLVAVNPAFVDFGTKAHYQSLSFGLFAVFLALVFARPRKGRDVLLATAVFAAWIATHHISVFMALAIVAVPVVAWPLIGRLGGPLSRGVSRTTAFLFVAYGLVFVTYWVSVSRAVNGFITWVFFTSAAAQGQKSGYYAVTRYETLDTLVAAALPFFVDNLHYSFLLAATGLGLWVLLTTDRVRDPRWLLAGVASLVGAALYFPNPAWIPLEGVVGFNRVQLVTLPFLVVLPALGLLTLLDRSRGSVGRRAVVAVVVFGLVFTSVSVGMANPNLANLAGYDKDHQRYLSSHELATADFVLAYAGDEQVVTSHSELPRVFKLSRGVEEGDVTRGETDALYDRVKVADGRVLVGEGLTVFSPAALAGHGVKVQDVDQGVGASVYDDTVTFERMAHSTVYDNADVVVQYRPPASTATPV